jgi:hypothetical protein
MVLLDSGNPHHRPGRRHDEEGPTELARVVGVDAVIGLLLPDEFQRFVLAGRHDTDSSLMGFRPLEVL